jgi:ubiquinone/menaquinone biosynthesis C-methylase UbiE
MTNSPSNIGSDLEGYTFFISMGRDSKSKSFDAVICQLGLMVFPNPVKVLRAMRRAVRQGGKVAALVFSTAEKNPYQGIPLGIARRFGSTALPLFSLGEADVLKNAFKEGGLLDIFVRPVSFRRHYSSAAEMIRSLKEGAYLREPIERLGEAERQKAWAEIERQLSRLEGPTGVDVPGEFLIGVGTK